ncbi:N-acetylmuramoyl-L-alanine amidase [Streptomyces sp. NPDC051776]|uniref:N-acetylmuramoyl-L-alanine amidase n=1 Tax=Streptomyces sp. NPDC051776 TaxID=3155414 RepID=UPI003419B76F
MSNGSPPAPRGALGGAVLLALAALAVSCGSGPGQSGATEGDGVPPARESASSPGGDTTDDTPDDDGDDGSPSSGRGPLSGKVVVIDPGHNPGNRKHAGEIGRSVDIGTGRKECDTTGTSTNDGYSEASFTLDVARRIRKLLEAEGATVKLTQDGSRPYGPCVDERARIGNEARADAAVSVHADGSATGNRGFHVILPAKVKEGSADTGRIVGPSRDLGERIAAAFMKRTGSAPSNYVGDKGLDVRSDLGGLNLSKIPKVFIECGNMRDSREADRLTSAKWRRRAAQGIADGIGAHLKQ